MCFKIGNAGCPKRLCQVVHVVLVVEKARSGGDCGLKAGHSYTPSLTLPWKRIAPV